ncbi:Uncharacterised protein [Halioglobus japonicus]|nr:Uncharacterised protein [Halioglobus japonicus]
MSEKSGKRPKAISDETRVKRAIDLIEEISWLLDSKRSISFREIPELLRDSLRAKESLSGSTTKYASPNPNIHYLIGILPRLFQDRKLFPKNEDIAGFADDVLGIKIPRVEKRSKYELIGMIVCESDRLDDKQLEEMVSSLALITGNADKIRQVAKERDSIGFSWNETIRNLAR